MKLKISFDEFKDAIEQLSAEHHYFIDKKKHQIIFISGYEDDPEAKLEELDNDNFISLPERMPNDDYGCIGGGNKEILTSSECQKCESSEIFEDFF